MMVITCIDVVGAKVFLWPVLGALDIVMLSQIRVEFFVARLPRRAQAVIDSVVFLVGLGLFIVIIWRLCVLGHSFQTSGEYSVTAHIPLYPFAYGIALASIPVCLVLLLEFLKSLTKMVQR